MTTRFSNTEDGVSGHEISNTGDFLIERDGEWFYWVGSSPSDNTGPYASAQEALDAYNGDADDYVLADVQDL